MASRKQEKERLRQERLEAQKRASSEARKRLVLGYIVAAVLGVAVIGGVIFAISSGGGGGAGGGQDDGSDNVNADYGFLPEDLPIDEREGTEPPEIANGDLTGAANVANCDLQLNLPDEGNTHFGDVDKVVERKTNPPTSGDHYGVNPTREEPGSGALADGAFLETPPENRIVHSLEHGRIAIQYSPDLPEEDQLALKGVFDADRGGVDLFPNADMPYDVAVTAWTNLVGCDTYEGAATLDVVRDFRDSFRGQGPENVIF